MRNEIRETRAPLQRVGIRLVAETSSIKREENLFRGLAREVEQVKAAANALNARVNCDKPPKIFGFANERPDSIGRS